jgi:hypothetical protein
MAIRDYFRVDVLVRVAAGQDGADVEFAGVERLLPLGDGDGGAVAACPGSERDSA